MGESGPELILIRATLMARRKKSSPAEDLMDEIALLPRWAGVALSVEDRAELTHLIARYCPTTKPDRI